MRSHSAVSIAASARLVRAATSEGLVKIARLVANAPPARNAPLAKIARFARSVRPEKIDRPEKNVLPVKSALPVKPVRLEARGEAKGGAVVVPVVRGVRAMATICTKPTSMTTSSWRTTSRRSTTTTMIRLAPPAAAEGVRPVAATRLGRRPLVRKSRMEMRTMTTPS